MQAWSKDSCMCHPTRVSSSIYVLHMGDLRCLRSGYNHVIRPMLSFFNSSKIVYLDYWSLSQLFPHCLLSLKIFWVALTLALETLISVLHFRSILWAWNSSILLPKTFLLLILVLELTSYITNRLKFMVNPRLDYVISPKRSKTTKPGNN